MYGRMENLSRETDTKYLMSYAMKKKEEAKKSAADSTSTSANVSPFSTSSKQSHSTPPTASMLAHAANSSDTPNKHQPFRRQSTSKSGASPGHAKKNTMFVLDALANRLDNITKANEIQSTYGGAQDNAAFERCQYMSKVKGRFTMPLPAQLMALEELSQEKLEHWILVKWPAMGAANTYYRLMEIDSFLDKKRVRCNQLLRLMQEARAPEEKLLIAITGCARLTDAIEADDQGLWLTLAPQLDALNLERAKLCVNVLAAEAQAEESSRSSRKAAREVHADVQRARKALGFMGKAVVKIRTGGIKADKFDQLKERLDAAADAAHEEYRDAVRDAKPANDFAAEAIKWMETAERLYEVLYLLSMYMYCNVVRSISQHDGMFESRLICIH
jgi:hypothetical protein